MKKSLLVATLLLVAGVTSAFATEAKDAWFTGLEVGSTSADFKISGNGASVSTNSSGGSQTLKIGKYLDKYGRVCISATRYNAESNVDLSSYGLSYDYMFYNSSAFTPFIGANIGAFNYKASGLDAELAGSDYSSSSDSISISGMTYGLNFGAMYEINKNFDIEIGGRLIQNNASDSVTITKISTAQSASVDAKIDKITQWYIGVNYNF